MTATQNTNHNYTILFSGTLTLLLGTAILLGWAFDLPWLTRINSDWKPMVPSTALCFMLGGLSLLYNSKSTDESASVAQKIFVWLILLLAGARAAELTFGHQFGIEFLLPDLGTQFTNVGHMPPPTMTGFLLFGIGMLLLQRQPGRKVQILVGIMAGVLILTGLGSTVGYWLNFPLIFETLYLQTELVWMSFHTSIGLFLLGIGLLSLLLRSRMSFNANTVEQQAKTIYRTTILVLAATAVTTGMAGISFLQETVYKQASVDMMHSLNAIRSHLEASINNRTERALVAALVPELKTAALHLLRNPDIKSSGTHLTQLTGDLLKHGFTGIGLDDGKQRRLIAGHLLPQTVPYFQLERATDTALAWDNGYYLRIRVPLSGTSSGYLVFEQSVIYINQLFEDANHWGTTGALVMCTRLDPNQLRCFPQREQANIYVVPDNYQGKPLPMTYALARQSGIASLTDYRGHKVLAAYVPVAATGLGLVLRKDLSEIYAPIRAQLLFALPLILVLVTVGWWLIRSRVRPLITGISSAYTSERTAKARFDAAMQSSPDGFVIAECINNEEGDIVDFRCVYLNRHAELIASHYFGKQGNLLGNSFFQVFPNQRDVFEKFKTVALTKKILVDELPVFNHEGDSTWFQRQTVPMANGIAVTYRDITQQKNLVQQLEYSNKLRTAIVEGAAYSIISTDVEGTILTFNQAAERMLWYRADELVGKVTPGVFHDAEEVKSRAISLSQELGYTVAPGFEVFVAKAKIHFQEEREWTYVRKDGSRFPVKLSVTALRDAQGQLEGFLGIAYDISEQKRSEEYIRHIALHDVLTGLPNRALLDDRVTVAIEQQRRNNIPFALAMMDIDRFKYINDTMGHHIGDRVLKEFVQRVKSCLRPTDTLARMGGDEFVLLLAESEEMGAKIVMERIRNILSTPINVELQEVHITSSIGISICPRDGHDMNELLRRADVAMYWVKEHGRNGYKIFLAEMDSGAVDRLGLERELHVALEKGGFTLFYQPQVDLKTNTILGVEALLRMRKIDGQYVFPADFIPLAEEIGLIVQIGQWVLQTACQDAARLQKMLGLPLGIVVNISPRQLVNGELVNQVQDALQQANLDAGLLELEITEGVLMDERNGVSSSLSELHNMGVKITIDDFGTGYSSLSYLKRYPINRLKIDQSFVRDISSDSGDAALVVAIIAMGQSLNIPVIAEGIESAEQLAFLIANNCNFGQGFYIGRPMPFDNLQQWFVNERRWRLDKASAATT